ncbi:tRNA pseudouridine(13) synthase TruD [Alteromonadaceae bacterium M269]|nr:tRNA pseudouridine(13) synthase TruD [Alteromonadaceae bacterium M269]
MLPTDEWAYLYGAPKAIGVFKSQAEDFQVEEQLGYELTGEGEHIYVWLQKQNLNTAFVAEQLAKQLNLPLRNVSYAGRKDKHALTRQWFGLHVPGKLDPNFDQFQLEGASILKTIRHNKKLKVGNLKGNRFDIRLREIENPQDIDQRLNSIQQGGVPNYFGPQRFGNNGSNLRLGLMLSKGEAIRNRNKRNLAISALRSWLFNQLTSLRIEQGNFSTLLDGDAVILNGSNSFFINDGTDLTLNDRIKDRDALLSAPLWGKGELNSTEAANEFEAHAASNYADICQSLEELGLEQQRRAISLYPENLTWKLQDNLLTLSFELPSGCFATSVLREVVNYREPERTQS